MTSEISSAPELIYYCEFDPNNWDDRLEITFSNEYKIDSSWIRAEFLITLESLTIVKHKAFFGENIIGVSAIAGKNGVGKTHFLKNIYRLRTSYILCLYKQKDYFFVERRDQAFNVFLNDEPVPTSQEESSYKLLFYNIPDISLDQDHVGIKDNRYRVVENNLSDLYRLLVKKDSFTEEFDQDFNITQRSSITCRFDYRYDGRLYRKLEKLVGEEVLKEYWQYVLFQSDKIFTAQVGLILLEICAGFFDKAPVKSKVIEFFKPEYYKELSMTKLMDDQKELIKEFFSDLPYRIKSIDKFFAWSALDFTARSSYGEFNGHDWGIKEDEFLSEFYGFLQGVEDVSPLKDYISIKLGEFSSGETAILNQLSVLAGRIERNIEEDGKSYQPRSMIIFIDEYENNLHPEWARQYLYYLLSFLNDYVSRDKNLFFQIILTTHSPYLISDLPKENIHLMSKDKDKDKDKDKKEKERITIKSPERSFASNYYDILSDSFFLKDTIGEFAKRKINGWVTELNELAESSAFDLDLEKLARIDELKKLINIVDDQFIRNKLLELANQVKDKILNSSDLESKKYRLDKKIKELQDERARLDQERCND